MAGKIERLGKKFEKSGFISFSRKLNALAEEARKKWRARGFNPRTKK